MVTQPYKFNHIHVSTLTREEILNPEIQSSQINNLIFDFKTLKFFISYSVDICRAKKGKK